MVKSSNPWLRGLLRAGKKQQRANARALQILLTPAKPAKAVKSAKSSKSPKSTKPAAAKTAKPGQAATPSSTFVTPFSLPAAAEVTTVRRQSLVRPAVAPGKWLTGQHAWRLDPGAGANTRMNYWLYLPAAPPKRGGWPLVVMLHGCDQSATLFAQGTRMNQHAEQAGCAVLYPQQSMAHHPHRCWKWYDRAIQQGGGEAAALADLVQKVLASYPIDRTRVYLGGLSAGAGMAHILALNFPGLFAALGLHSGPLFGGGHSTIGALAVMRHGASALGERAIAEVSTRLPAPMPTVLIQGAEDTVVHPANQDQLERQIMALNQMTDARIDVTHKPGTTRCHPHVIRDVYQRERLLLRVVRIAELKHAWSGGDGQLAFNSGAGPDASKIMLSFFRMHRRMN